MMNLSTDQALLTTRWAEMRLSVEPALSLFENRARRELQKMLLTAGGLRIVHRLDLERLRNGCQRRLGSTH